MRTAARIVSDVSRMREAAKEEGSRLLTFTVEADVAFAAPADIARFTRAAGRGAGRPRGRIRAGSGKGRTYRVTVAGHPAVETKIGKSGRPAVN